MKGLFIGFEGGEGSGKSTQARVLYRRLVRAAYDVLLLHEPGGTPAGESIRRLIKGPLELSPLAELLLFEAARNLLVTQKIKPSLANGDIVICDRFVASTVAYQGYGRGLDLGVVESLNTLAAEGTTPDRYVFLDVPVEKGLARKGGMPTDRFQEDSLDFHRRVKEGYLSMARKDPHRWIVINGDRPKRDVAGDIWNRVAPLLGPGRPRPHVGQAS